MKLTDKFPIPSEINFVSDQIQIGSYTIGYHQPNGTDELGDSHLVIIGRKVFDLSMSKVCPVECIPCTKDYAIKTMTNLPFDDLEDTQIYHKVVYGGYAWLFSTMDSALRFASIIYEFKMVGLVQSLNTTIVVKEINAE